MVAFILHESVLEVDHGGFSICFQEFWMGGCYDNDKKSELLFTTASLSRAFYSGSPCSSNAQACEEFFEEGCDGEGKRAAFSIRMRERERGREKGSSSSRGLDIWSSIDLTTRRTVGYSWERPTSEADRPTN